MFGCVGEGCLKSESYGGSFTVVVRPQERRGRVAAPVPASPHATMVAAVLLTQNSVVSGRAEHSSSDASVPSQSTSASATGRLAGSTCIQNALAMGD